MSDGSFLRFYVREDQRHGHVLLWQWLLEQANKLGVRGGTAFRGMAGFGRHRELHESRFFELAGSLVIEVEFIVNAKETTDLLELIERERIRVFYARVPATFGILNPDAQDSP